MSIVIFLGMSKTFFFMRIFDRLSPLVTMLSNVIVDLLPFMFFFFILMLMFSMQLGIMGLSNIDMKGEFKEKFHDER